VLELHPIRQLIKNNSLKILIYLEILMLPKIYFFSVLFYPYNPDNKEVAFSLIST